MGRGFDNNRIAAPTHFEVVKHMKRHGMQRISQASHLGFAKTGWKDKA